MPDSKSPLKRFGFKRTNTSGEPAPHTTTTELGDLNVDQATSSKLAAEYAGDVHDHPDVVQDISEVEANRKLSVIQQDFFGDPNMPDAAFDAVNQATQAHDRKSEAVLVGELIDDSPYPEVRSPEQRHPLFQ